MSTSQPTLAAPGLEIGERAPGFALPDQLGRVVSLDAQLAQGPVVLVFCRGDWCPYCNLTLRRLQAELETFRAHGAQLLAVSPQAPDRALTLAETHALEFPVLSDVEQATIAAYRVRYAVRSAVKNLLNDFGNDLSQQNANRSWSLPIPATFVIDDAGVIRARFVDADFTKRTDADIVAALAELSANGRRRDDKLGAGPPRSA